ncbi:alcohol oxidase [Serendipita vermifera]|nr:alcohol oxidase [Serendipita vermifera]
MHLPVLAAVLVTTIVTPVKGLGSALLVGRDVELRDKYDFVVIGRGTSGLVIANRLTERSSKTVLVIESGDLDQREESVLIPHLEYTDTEPKYMYNITSTPQPGLNNRAVGIYAAHVVGGGSTVNRMFFDRGSKADYNLWEDLGNPGWGWNSLLPYFKKSETFHPPSSDVVQDFRLTYDPSIHGTSGPIHSSYPPFLYPATRNFLSAIEEFGSHVPRDGASGDALGPFWVPNTLDPSSMTRSYARTGYYDTASTRSNLHLLTGMTATKIIFQGKTATGVQFAPSRGESLQTVKVKLEVIVAAGSQHTPQLLLLSGIGDKSFLGPNNVKNATWLAEQRVWTMSWANSAAFLPFQEFTNRTNEFVSAIQQQNPAEFLPNTHPTLIAGVKEQLRLVLRGVRDKNIAFAEYPNGASPAMALVVLKPFSRGSVLIISTDPFADPVVDFGVYNNPVDLEVALEMLKSWRRLLTMPSWAALGTFEFSPGINMTSHDDLVAYIRGASTPTIGHPCCTAAMMPKNLGGVVGSDLKVYEVNGLSIGDASIIPVIPSTHLVSTVYAVAEKGPDMGTPISTCNCTWQMVLDPSLLHFQYVCSARDSGGYVLGTNPSSFERRASGTNSIDAKDTSDVLPKRTKCSLLKDFHPQEERLKEETFDRGS